MAWIDHALWWHIYPLGMTDAPIRDGDSRTGRGFSHMTGWLDYVQELGLNGIVLGPIFASRTHGYDTVDYFQIDPRLGTLEDATAFFAACRERGIRVILDGVFSHASVHHDTLRAALELGSDSPQAGLFDIDWEADGGPAPRVWEGHGELARFRHDGEAARDFVSRIMRHWLELGIDGWRLDAAYSVPTDFWRAVIDPLREYFPKAWFMGEVIHGDYVQFVEDSGVDSVTEYELWKAAYSSIENTNMFELEWTLGRHNTFAEAFVPYTFVGNHDTTRIASFVGTEGSLVAHAVIFTLPGTPAIYYGDEQAFRGVKEERVGGDDEVRPAFPAAPGSGQDLPFIGDGPAMRDALAGLIALRRAHPWLVTARIEVEDVANERLIYRAIERAEDPRWLRVSIDVLEGALTPAGADGVRAQVRIEEADGTLAWSAPTPA